MAAYSRFKGLPKYDTDGTKSLAIPQQNWQGVNYVDEASAMQPMQVPHAKNVDFGDPIGAAAKRGGTELLFASLGSGGMKGLHCWKHSSGNILLGAWGTVLYNLAGGSGSVVKTSQADWDAGTKSETESASSPGDLKLLFGTDFSETDTLTADFSGTHSNTQAVEDAVKLAADSPDAYTKLLLHCNGNDGSTTFTDETGKTVTANGNAQIDTAQSKFGGASGLFDGTGDYLSVPDSADWAFGTGDFTVDFWIRFPDVGIQQGIMGQYADSNNFSQLWYFGSANSYKWQFYQKDGGTVRAQYIMTNAWTPSNNTWYHIAFVRNGSVAKLFIDGVGQALTETVAFGTLGDIASALALGVAYNAAGSPTYTNGHIDEFRVSKGIARWTANFTPSTSEYAAYQLSGAYTNGAQDVSGAQKVSASSITFNKTTPAGTTVTVEVRISTDGGSNWGAWTEKTSGDSVIAAGTLIPDYQLQWRANLTTVDETVTPSLNDVTVSVTAVQATTGTWVSPTLDIGNTPLTATLSWTQTTPAGTSVEWQTRVSDNGTDFGDYRTINASGDGIPLGRYVQIKIILTGTVAATPTVSDFTVAYTTSYTTATSIKTELSGNRVRFADYSPKDYCIVCDGGRPQIVYKNNLGVVTVRDAGIDPPNSAPTIADGGAGSITGTYYAKVTYVHDDGAESNPSAASGSLVIASKQIAWSSIPTGPAGTASRKLYRTKAGGSVYYLVTTIEDNVTTTYTDTTADSALTTLMEDDNNVPPDAKIVFEFMNYMFYVSADDESQLWFSKVGQPEQVPNITTSMYFKSMPGAILGIEATHNAVVVGGEDFVNPIIATSTGHIFDSDPTVDTTIVRHIDKAGALSQESIKMCVDPELRQIMLFPTVTGVRFLLPGLQENSLESVPLSRNVQTYYDQAVNRHNMAAAFFNNRYILSFTWQEPGAATATANNVIFVYDFRSKQWYGPWTIGASCFAIAGNELYCGDAAAGKVYKMFSGSSDAGSAIEMILDLPVVAPAGLQGTCRFTRFLVEVSADSVTTSTVVKPKVDDREASISLGTLTSSFTGDERPGHNTIRSRKYAIPLAQGHALSHRIVDNSTNPLTVHKVIAEYEVVPVRT